MSDLLEEGADQFARGLTDEGLRIILKALNLEVIRREVKAAEEAMGFGNVGKVLPYLLEDVYIPSCPVVGKVPLDLSDITI
ncbi:MAG: hypothetical protein ACRC8R_12085 [Aeromonas hydrophila]